jgi:hypothetical protein
MAPPAVPAVPALPPAVLPLLSRFDTARPPPPPPPPLQQRKVLEGQG